MVTIMATSTYAESVCSGYAIARPPTPALGLRHTAASRVPGPAPDPAARISALEPQTSGPYGQASRALIGRTRFRILGRWLRRAMSCSAVGRGHRRSWSWPAMESRICCAGRGMSETDLGMPGCPGSSPPGIPSGTATTWSAYAPMRCGAWRTRPRTRGCRVAGWAATAGSGRGPRPHLSSEAPTIPGRSPGKMTRSGDSAPSGGTPDTERACR